MLAVKQDALLHAEKGDNKTNYSQHDSNDNSNSEAQPKTLKHRPGLPAPYPRSRPPARTARNSTPGTTTSTATARSALSAAGPHHGHAPADQAKRAQDQDAANHADGENS